jgi:hypothetical protein
MQTSEDQHKGKQININIYIYIYITIYDANSILIEGGNVEKKTVSELEVRTLSPLKS